jgi:hypothetical protein
MNKVKKTDVEFKIDNYSIFVDIADEKEIKKVINYFINNLEVIYNERGRNASAQYSHTRVALNQLLEYALNGTDIPQPNR